MNLEGMNSAEWFYISFQNSTKSDLFHAFFGGGVGGGWGGEEGFGAKEKNARRKRGNKLRVTFHL